MYKETFEFLTNIQQNSSNFFKRLKDSNEPFYRKIVKVIFFFNFMIPSALLCVNPLMERLVYPVSVICVLTWTYKPIFVIFIFWIGLIFDNALLGVLYHKWPFFKKSFDSFCYGEDIVFAFFGNTGSAASRMTYKAAKGFLTAGGVIIAEHLVADSYGYAKAALKKAENPSIDFGAEWDKHSENFRDYMPAHAFTKKK